MVRLFDQPRGWRLVRQPLRTLSLGLAVAASLFAGESAAQNAFTLSSFGQSSFAPNGSAVCRPTTVCPVGFTASDGRCVQTTQSPFWKGVAAGLTDDERRAEGVPGGSPAWSPSCGHLKIAPWSATLDRAKP